MTHGSEPIRRLCYQVAIEVEGELRGEFCRVAGPFDWQQVLDRASAIRREAEGLYEVDGPDGTRTYMVDGAP